MEQLITGLFWVLMTIPQEGHTHEHQHQHHHPPAFLCNKKSQPSVHSCIHAYHSGAKHGAKPSTGVFTNQLGWWTWAHVGSIYHFDSRPLDQSTNVSGIGSTWNPEFSGRDFDNHRLALKRWEKKNTALNQTQHLELDVCDRSTPNLH